MQLIELTNDQGAKEWVNPALVLSVKIRPGKSELGTLLRLQNGTLLGVIEGLNDVLKRLGTTTNPDHEGNQ
jgi:hypothetical protein